MTERIVVKDVKGNPTLLTEHSLKENQGYCRDCHCDEIGVNLVFGNRWSSAYACKGCQYVFVHPHCAVVLDTETTFNILVKLGYIDPKDYPYEVKEP